MEKERIIDLSGFDIEGNVMYFNTYYANGIFQMDMSAGNVDYLTMSEKYGAEARVLYQNSKVCKGKIWFAPYAADDILIYDLDLNTCEYIGVPKLKGHGREFVKFYGIYDYESWLIFIPVEYPAILKVNKETYKINIIKLEEKILAKYPNFFEVNERLSIAHDYEIIDEKMYLLAENIMIKYDMKTDELSFNQVNEESRIYTGIAQYRDGLVLVDRMYSEVAVWNEESESVEKLDTDLGYQGTGAEKADCPKDGCPLGIFKVAEGIAIVQANADFLVVVDKLGQSRKINLDITRRWKDDFLFFCVKQMGNQLIIPLNGQNKVLLVDTNDWSQRLIKMNLDNLDFTGIRKKIENEDKYTIENTVYYDLLDLIDYMAGDEAQEEIKIEQQNVGKYIFDNI